MDSEPALIVMCSLILRGNMMKTALILTLLLSYSVFAATIYVDPNASGADDGTSWTDANEVLSEVTSDFSPGDIIMMKGGTYSVKDGTAVWYQDVAGTIAAPITVMGDDGEGNPATVTFDGATNGCTAAAACMDYTIFKYCDFIGGSQNNVQGTDVETTPDYCEFYYCNSSGATQYGWNMDDGILLYRCTATGNGSGGINIDAQGTILGCIVHDNTGPEIIMHDTITVVGSLVYDDEEESLFLSTATLNACWVINSTFDGIASTNAGVGLDFDAVTNMKAMPRVINSSFTNLGVPITCNADYSGQEICVCCAFDDNTSAPTNVSTGYAPVTDITFVGGGDYTPAADSNSIDNGFDARITQTGAGYMDIGAIQATSGEFSVYADAFAAAVWAHANAPTVVAGRVKADSELFEGQDVTDLLDALDFSLAEYLDPNGRFPSVLVDISLGAGVATKEDLRTEIDANSTQLAAIVAAQFDPNTTPVLTDSNSITAIVTAMETDGSKLDHLWEMTEDDAGTRRLTTNALEQAPTGGLDAAGIRTALGMASADMDTQLDALLAWLEKVWNELTTKL